MVVKRAKADPDGIIAARLPGTVGRHATPVAPPYPFPLQRGAAGVASLNTSVSQKVGERQ